MVISKLISSSKSIILIIPKQITKKLNLCAKNYVGIEIVNNNSLVIKKLEVKPAEFFVDGKPITTEVISINNEKNDINIEDEEISGWSPKIGGSI